MKGALEAQFKLAPLKITFGMGTFPSITTNSLNLIGIKVGSPAKPMLNPTEKNMNKLKCILEEIIGRRL